MPAEPSGDARQGATLLLPAAEHWVEGLPSAPRMSRWLAQADASVQDAGDEAQLARGFELLPRGLPVAALTREHDCGDAAPHAWLRADPAHIRADLGAGRMMACGELGLAPDEVEQLMQPLRPLFGDDGALLSAGAPSRWYLALPREAKLPSFTPPHRVLGDDIFPHLPQGDAGRRWRRLLNEAQVVLHNHPVNAARIAAGKLPVNSLWFWGGGVLPDHVRTAHHRVYSDDLLLAALARAASREHGPLPAAAAGGPGGALIDLRRLRDAAALERDWVAPLVDAVRRGRIAFVQFDLADGRGFRWQASHRWRFWRGSRPRLA